jgi:glycosyltransferase involved in cell wall biosynthesis
MKITFVLPCVHVAGGIRVIVSHAKYLIEKGHQVSVIAPRPTRQNFLHGFKSFLKQGIFSLYEIYDPTYFELNQVPFTLSSHASVWANDVPDADIIIATWWETAEWIAKFPIEKGKKVYFIQHHETIIDRQNLERIKATYRLPFQKVTISRWLTELLLNEYGDKSVFLVPNSVDMELFYAEPRVKNTIPKVGFMYSDLLWKGADICLAAIQQLKTVMPSLTVTCFSYGPISADIPLPEEVDVHLRPPQHHLRHLYAACDVWLCGSRAEGFGLPILEAMACRCPVVSVRTGGAPDLIKPGVNGFLVPPEDTEGLAESLAKVLQLSDRDWQAMSNAAHQTATRYTWKDAADQLENALMKILENP